MGNNEAIKPLPLLNQCLEKSSVFFRAIPSFKGKTRLIRILNQIFLTLGAEPIVTSRSGDLSQFILDLRSRTELVPYYLGEYDKATNRLIQSTIKEGWIVLDVGANIGFLSVPLGKQIGPKGKMYCFEPLPSNFDRLLENLKLNSLEERAQCIPIALSDHEGELQLGLFGDFKKGGLTGNAVPMSKGHSKPFKEVTVKKMTLDSWVNENNLERLDFIKVDIEGHEDSFIRGAAKTIEKFRPLILGEFSENHMAFKGVDVDVFYKNFASEFKYKAFDFRGCQLTEIYTLKNRKNFEDILLIPSEKIKP